MAISNYIQLIVTKKCTMRENVYTSPEINAKHTLHWHIIPLQGAAYE